MADTTAPERSVQALDRVVIRFAGDSGDGMQLTGDRFTTVSALFGTTSPLFPTFAGSLEATADGAGTQLALRGCYRTPLGRLGALGDEVIGWRLARSALEGLVISF